MFFAHLLRYVIREGAVRLIDARGREHIIGDGTAPCCTVRLHAWYLDYKLAFNPALRFGEAYMDGLVTIEDGDLSDFLDIVGRNSERLDGHPLTQAIRRLWRRRFALKPYNPIAKAQRNVAHHYDLSGKLYDLFLDRDRQYSCAYFTSPQDSLETAQENKKRHIAAKLLLNRPGMKILDIGSGWGGLGLYLARLAKAKVTGVTLSHEQYKLSQARAREAGLAKRVQFFLRDYRDETGTFERIVSVGMFEHVGKRHYGQFFGKVRDLLAEDGVALLHSIGRFDTPAPINPFIRKYIFPGADIPAMSEVLAAVEQSGLVVTDIEILRLHYAETLKAWRRRFHANWDKVRDLYDERFCRMWEMYLAGCEMGFRYQGLMVFQMQLAKKQDAVPLTRDYITEFERKNPAVPSLAAE